ncbi:MAG: fimbrial assembly protein [Paraburkholderia sp.]|uniref:fimbrial assembly protein n=1 Tax=Paraburkholderia sp. TaxID=1926495 RepID=UPI003C595C9C
MTSLNSPMPARGHRFWIGGFNLLPYRRSNARRARRRCLIEWLVAALLGCAALLATVGWQAFERTRLDAQRTSNERVLAQLTAPLAEHARLSREMDERGKRATRAVDLSMPLTRLLDLLDTLSGTHAEGVILQQLHQRLHETELLATANDPVASAVWLKQLGTVRGVKGSEVTDLHPLARARPGTTVSGTGALEFAARLRWDEEGEREKNIKPQREASASVSDARSRAADNSRGAR